MAARALQRAQLCALQSAKTEGALWQGLRSLATAPGNDGDIHKQQQGGEHSTIDFGKLVVWSARVRAVAGGSVDHCGCATLHLTFLCPIGFREVPRESKQDLVGAVFRSVAPSYDVMNDLMSGGEHCVG